MRCIDIDYLISSYVLHRYAATLRVKSCLASFCSNVAVGCNIAVSIRNYVFKRIHYAIRCNASACIQSNVTIVRGEISVCCNILRCIDIDYLISSYVLHRYAATLRVKSCFAGLCSNIAVGIDIAVSVCNYVVKRIHYARCNASACIQSNITIVRSEFSVCCNILRGIDIYIILGSYITDGYNRTLLRINAYIIRCIQISATSRGNVAICLNSNITVMRIIVLRSIDS